MISRGDGPEGFPFAEVGAALSDQGEGEVEGMAVVCVGKAAVWGAGVGLVTGSAALPEAAIGWK